MTQGIIQSVIRGYYDALPLTRDNLQELEKELIERVREHHKQHPGWIYHQELIGDGKE